MKNKHAVELGKLGGAKSGGYRPNAGRPKLPVIHTPGLSAGDKQHCTRCGSVITDNSRPSRAGMDSFWRAGVEIISYGHGSMGVATAEEIASVRFCGSKKEVSK